MTVGCVDTCTWAKIPNQKKFCHIGPIPSFASQGLWAAPFLFKLKSQKHTWPLSNKLHLYYFRHFLQGFLKALPAFRKCYMIKVCYRLCVRLLKQLHWKFQYCQREIVFGVHEYITEIQITDWNGLVTMRLTKEVIVLLWKYYITNIVINRTVW